MFYDSSDIDLNISIEDYYEANVFIYSLKQININQFKYKFNHSFKIIFYVFIRHLKKM